MIWEGDYRGTDTKDHTGVDLCVGVGEAVVGVFEIVEVHGDHGGFLFFDVEEINIPLLNQTVKAQLPVIQLLYNTTLHQELVLLHNEQRPHNPTGISINLNLFKQDIVDNRGVL